MSIASATNRNDYTGNGSASQFTYTFKIDAASELEVYTKDLTGVEALLTLGADYTVNTFGASYGGTITLIGGALTTGHHLTIKRKIPIVQTVSIKNQRQFYPETHEHAWDRIVMMVQQVQETADRAIKTSPTALTVNFDPTLPTVLGANQTLVVSADGLGIALGPTPQELSDASAASSTAVTAAAEAEASADLAAAHAAQTALDVAYTDADATDAAASAASALSSATSAASSATAAAAHDILYGVGLPLIGNGVDGNSYIDTVSGIFYKKIAGVWEEQVQLTAPSGVPVGGSTGDVLTKLSNTDEDADWVSFSYSGYSARFGALFESYSLDDTLAKILNLQYSAPTISLSATGSTTIREKGTSVPTTTLTATVVKRSDPIEEVRFYAGATFLTAMNGTIPNGGTESYAYNTPFTDNITFSSQVDDDGSTGGPTTVTASTSFVFVYPYYNGAGNSGLSAASVATLSKTLITSTGTVNKTFTASNSDVFYFAYPASYGALTSILDVNNFETLGDWTLRTENITGLDGNAVSYRIYEFENPVVAGSYYYSFRR